MFPELEPCSRPPDLSQNRNCRCHAAKIMNAKRRWMHDPVAKLSKQPFRPPFAVSVLSSGVKEVLLSSLRLDRSQEAGNPALFENPAIRCATALASEEGKRVRVTLALHDPIPTSNLRFSRENAASWLPRSMAAFFLPGLD
jgi:hypothetical protein